MFIQYQTLRSSLTKGFSISSSCRPVNWLRHGFYPALWLAILIMVSIATRESLIHVTFFIFIFFIISSPRQMPSSWILGWIFFFLTGSSPNLISPLSCTPDNQNATQLGPCEPHLRWQPVAFRQLLPTCDWSAPWLASLWSSETLLKMWGSRKGYPTCSTPHPLYSSLISGQPETILPSLFIL